jgi:hypothetical protein
VAPVGDLGLCVPCGGLGTVLLASKESERHVASIGQPKQQVQPEAAERTAGEPRRVSPTDPVRDLFESVILEPLAFVASVPELLAKGRAKIESQTKTANMIGKFVVPMAKRKIDAELKTMAESVRSYLTSTETKRGPNKPTTPAAEQPRQNATSPKSSDAPAQVSNKAEPKSKPVTVKTRAAKTRVEKPTGAKRPAVKVKLSQTAVASTVNDLGLDNYDDLPASSVVGLIEALTPNQLRAISVYESSHRNRQTILGGVARLLDSAQ